MGKKTIFAVSLVLFLVLITGCTSGLLNNDLDTETETGELNLKIADNAVNELAHVYVYIDEVNVQHEDGGWETIADFEDEEDGMKKVDLLELRFTEEVLGQETLPVGNYNKIRLKLAADYEDGEDRGNQEYLSRLVFEDDNIDDMPLKVPAGSQKGFQIEYDFNLEENIIMELVLDVDLTKLVAAGQSGKILLNTQAINVIDTEFSGNINGQVLGESEDQEGNIINEPITDLEDRDVYVEAYSSEDYDSDTEEFADDAEPKATSTASIEDSEDKEAGSFMLRGLLEGDYILKSFVGSRNDDDEVVIDDSEYQPTILADAVTVEAGENQTLEDPIVLEKAETEEEETVE